MMDMMLRLIDFDFHNMTIRNRVLPSKHRPTAHLQTHRQRGKVIPVRHSFHGVCRFVCVSLCGLSSQAEAFQIRSCNVFYFLFLCLVGIAWSL